MRRSLALVLMVFMALMPMSVIAGYSSGAGAADAQEMPCHGHDGSGSDEGSQAFCGDMKGCCGAFLPPAVVEAAGLPAGVQRVLAGKSLSSGFVPDHVDPPPVVL